jgi:hypothetical protein
MPIRGPLATLLAVAATGAAVVATNVVLTAGPSDVEKPTAALSANEAAYGSGGSSGSGAAAPAPAAPAAPSAPAAPAAPVAPARYDGRTAGDEVTVQVTVDNGQAKAYICSRDKGIESWVKGTVADGKMQLSGDDGASVDATSDGKAVFGTATAKGKSWPFAAAVSKDAAPAAGSAPAPAAPAQPQAPAQQAPAQQPAPQPSYSGGGY